MKARICACIPVLLVILAMPAFGASSLNLVIERPDGVCTLDLSAETDGPVWLPVESKQLDAVQLTTAASDDALTVTVWAVRDGAAIDPVAEHELTLGSEPVALWELAPYGLDGWFLGLTLKGDAEAETCGGCSCGTLCCDPNPGFCMGCGGCGNCCKEPEVN